MNFIHLRLHTEYSLRDSTIRIKKLVAAAVDNNMPSIAMTDLNNFFAMVKFYNAANSVGIKPIFGLDIFLDSESTTQPHHMILLCQNNQGYRNLTKLISRAYLKGQVQGIPIVKKDWIKEFAEGVIALSGGRHSDVGQLLIDGHPNQARERVKEWQRLFPDRYYLELQRTGRPQEEDYNHAAVELAIETQTPVVATNDVRFLKSEEFQSHEARVCIADGYVLDDPNRPKHYSPQQYLRTAKEMIELFDDIPEAIENTVEIAKRCTVELQLYTNYLPDFPIPDGMTINEFFSVESRKGLEERLDFLYDRKADDFEEKRKPYDERLQIELDVINDMGFPGYFLIVADFIQWAKDNAVPVGPGRGSGAGSLVAYALKITDLDPLEYDLLFERFLNPERVSMPDFDIDFCMEKRDQVIDYVAQTYGREKVSQIITYGSMAAKAVVRDCGRVLGHPYGFVDRVAKQIPPDLGMTLTKALEESEDLKHSYDTNEEVKALMDLALSLEGLSRNTGKHAGGVLISPSDLTDFTPLYCEEDGTNVVSQFDKNDVEAVGLVKFDFLGLRNLTIIDWALKTINEKRAKKDKEPIRIEAIDLEDKASFDLLKACNTTAVFQLESRGMKELIKRLQPDVFEDIVALVALYRPGPLGSGMVDDFVNRKHGIAKTEYPHPWLEEILKPTYGVILYQEQVMQIAQVLASYTLGGADMLRRAMGKKKPEEMEKQRAIFMEGALKNNVEADTATYIFDLMEKFAGYGFNKSHSAAYALVSFQTAWLKAHYPAAFMAAVLSSDMDNTEKVVTFIDDCRQMNIEVVPPGINNSKFHFTVDDENRVVYGLGAIKGAGEAAINVIQENVEQKGKFKSLVDLCKRVASSKVTKRVLEVLIMGGAFDCFGNTRAAMMAFLPEALHIADQHHRDQLAGQFDLFGGAINAGDGGAEPIVPHKEEWEENQRLTYEKEALGLYLTGHPINEYEKEIRQFTSHTLAELAADDSTNGSYQKLNVTIAGQIAAIRVQNTDNGKRAFLMLDDRSAYMEVACFTDTYSQFEPLLVKDAIIIIEGTLSTDRHSGRTRFRVENIHDMEGARTHFARRMKLVVNQRQTGNGIINQLKQAFVVDGEHHCPIMVEYHTDKARVNLMLGDEFNAPTTDLGIDQLKRLLGNEAVIVQY